jgi:hypothetical protein
VHRSQIVGVAALISCLALSACGTSRDKSKTAIGAPGSSPSATSTGAGSTVVITPNPTPVVTALPGGRPPADVPLVVSVSVDQQADVVTANCPYTFTIDGKITVNKGPVDVAYSWKSSESGPKNSGTIHFGGAGPQFATLSTQVIANVVTKQLYESLLLDNIPYDKSHTATIFALTCGGSASVPVANPTHAPCPYTAKFSSDITVQMGPQTVTYEWILDGADTIQTGTRVFPGAGLQKTTVEVQAAINGLGLLGRFTAALRITSAGGMLTKATSVTCDPVNHT